MPTKALTIAECVSVPARDLTPGTVLLDGQRIEFVETGDRIFGESVRVTLEGGRFGVVGGGLRLLCDPATIERSDGS